MQTILHYFLHLIFPVFIAYLFYKDRWIKVYLIFLAGMLLDLDHLLADPIFDPCRCSIGFHPLHSYPAIACYLLFLIFPKFKVLGFSLLFHVATDGIDCLFIPNNC